MEEQRGGGVQRWDIVMQTETTASPLSPGHQLYYKHTASRPPQQSTGTPAPRDTRWIPRENHAFRWSLTPHPELSRLRPRSTCTKWITRIWTRMTRAWRRWRRRRTRTLTRAVRPTRSSTTRSDPASAPTRDALRSVPPAAPWARWESTSPRLTAQVTHTHTHTHTQHANHTHLDQKMAHRSLKLFIYVEHKTSHKGPFLEIEIYASSESWINNLSIDVWFVMIGQYL